MGVFAEESGVFPLVCDAGALSGCQLATRNLADSLGAVVRGENLGRNVTSFVRVVPVAVGLALLAGACAGLGENDASAAAAYAASEVSVPAPPVPVIGTVAAEPFCEPYAEAVRNSQMHLARNVEEIRQASMTRWAQVIPIAPPELQADFREMMAITQRRLNGAPTAAENGQYMERANHVTSWLVQHCPQPPVSARPPG